MGTKDDLRKEYPADLIRSGERGKYAGRVPPAVPAPVVIDPDLRDRVPDSASVNRALRAYLQQEGARSR